LVTREYKKKQTQTIENLKQSAAKGEASTTITFPVIKADDHNITNAKGKNCTIKITLLAE
jgi:hypothetical protein